MGRSYFKWADDSKKFLKELVEFHRPTGISDWEIVLRKFKSRYAEFSGLPNALRMNYDRTYKVVTKKSPCSLEEFKWSDSAIVDLIRLTNKIQVLDYPNWSKILHVFKGLYPNFFGTKNALKKAHARYKFGICIDLKDPNDAPSCIWNTSKHEHLLQALDKAESIRNGQLIDGRKQKTSNIIHDLVKHFKIIFKSSEKCDYMGSDMIILMEYYRLSMSSMKGHNWDSSLDNVSNYDYKQMMSYASKNHMLTFCKLMRYCCHNCGFLFIKEKTSGIKFRNSTILDSPRICDIFQTDLYIFKKEDKFVTCIDCFRNPKWVNDYNVTLTSTNNHEVPEPLQDLNEYERNQIAICGGFYTLYKYQNKERRIFEHRQGESNIGKKRDIDYYKVFTTYFGVERPLELDESKEKIVSALRWLRKNNHLFTIFYANYETLFRYVMSIQKCRPEERLIQVSKGTVQDVVGKETCGLVIPSEDVRLEGSIHPSTHLFGIQHPLQSNLDNIRSVINVNYADENLEAKRWPHLFPEGVGSWKQKSSLKPQTYVKKRLLNIDNRFRMTNEFMFFWLDRLIKSRLLYCNNRSRSVHTKDLLTAIKKQDLDKDQYKYGTSVPASIPGSRTYWGARRLDLLALVRDLGKPHFFITLTQNDNWVELQHVTGHISQEELEHINQEIMQPAIQGNSVVEYPVEVVAAFYRRLEMFTKSCINNKRGPFGEVTDYWHRIEYQNRGALHCHMVIWVCEETIPENVVSAEMPRYSGSDDLINKYVYFAREYVTQFQLHTCYPDRCYSKNKGKSIQKCKYGFPFGTQSAEEINDSKMGHKYIRRHEEDSRVVPYNLHALMCWNGHINVQKVTSNGIEAYLCKYISKPEKSIDIRDLSSDAEKFLKSRIVGVLECCSILLQLRQCSSTRQVVYLPCDFVPTRRMLKRQSHLPQDEESEDIYYKNALDKYLCRPLELDELTYPDLFRFYDVTLAKGIVNRGSQDEDSDPEFPARVDEEPSMLSQRISTIKSQRKTYFSSGYKYTERGKAAIPKWRYLVPFGKDAEKYYEQYLLLNVPISRGELNVNGFPFSDDNTSETFIEECCIRDLIDAEKSAKTALIGAIQHEFSVSRVIELANMLVDKDFVTKQYTDSILLPWIDSMPELEGNVDEYEDEHGEELARMFENRMKVEKYEVYLSNMTESQRSTMEWIQGKLKNEDQILAIITGGAGVGKSYITKAIYSLFLERKELCVLLATTGSAANIISGTTLHYYLKIDIEGNSYLEGGTLSAKIIEDTNAIIVDEFSMLSSDLLDSLQKYTRQYSESGRSLFGGKHVFFIGDPLQIPSIAQSVFTNPLLNEFSVLILKETVRQADTAFADLLNRVRVLNITAGDKKVLRSRFVKQEDIQLTGDVLVVTATRAKMDFYNKKFITAFGGETIEILAEDFEIDGCTRVSKSVEENIRKYVKNRWEDLLILKEGCIVRLLRNIDVANGWVNSKRAKLFRIGQDGSYVILQDMDDATKQLPLTKMRQLIKIGQTSYYRLQYCLKLGYASTVHAVQGVTVTGKYYVDLDRSFWESGQAFVALSRPKDISQLFLLNTHFEKILSLPYYQLLYKWMMEHDEIAFVKKDRQKNDFPLLAPNTNIDSENKLDFPNISTTPKKPMKKYKNLPFKRPAQINNKKPTKILMLSLQSELRSLNFPSNTTLTDNVSSVCTVTETLSLRSVAEEFSRSCTENWSVNQKLHLGSIFFDQMLTCLNDDVEIYNICDPRNCLGDENIKAIWENAMVNMMFHFVSYVIKYRTEIENFLNLIRNLNIQVYQGEPLHTSVDIPVELSEKIKAVATSPDGRCFYHAVSINLCGTQSLSNALKLLCAFILFDNMEYFDNILRPFDSSSKNVMLKSLSFNNWADFEIINVMSYVVMRPLCVINRFCRSSGLSDLVCNPIRVSKQPVTVAYVEVSRSNYLPVNPNHYVAILQTSSAFIDLIDTEQERGIHRSIPETIDLCEDDPMTGVCGFNCDNSTSSRVESSFDSGLDMDCAIDQDDQMIGVSNSSLTMDTSMIKTNYDVGRQKSIDDGFESTIIDEDDPMEGNITSDAESL